MANIQMPTMAATAQTRNRCCRAIPYFSAFNQWIKSKNLLSTGGLLPKKFIHLRQKSLRPVEHDEVISPANERSFTCRNANE
jgi:hypothetical protein